MGQLIKLQDYISRYEQDIYRYPAQFVRLKKQQWTKVKAAFLAGELETLAESAVKEEEYIALEKDTVFTKMKKIFKRQETFTETLESTEVSTNEEPLDLSFALSSKPETVEELKRSFLNQVFRFQLKWVSSTIREKSYIDQVYFFDEKLKFFLQRFPDNFLILYKPIFLVKNAPIELEIIILSPTETWCITILEGEENAAFIGSKERFWVKRHHVYGDKKVLNPLLSVNRTAAVVTKIYSSLGIELPVKKAIISRNGYIDYPSAPHDTMFVDKKIHQSWLERMRSTSSPLKHNQLKAAQALLDYCQTTYSHRLEWDKEIEDGSKGENRE
ncbi:NERD domain-containing protein [Peribacillus deserti]|uniref:NERD domain-containing protein n=1 Tax=Peribacillus deserti TaxID=673318 RepID=A0A2N5M4E1_9BACI|nr:NERD domain-containing protein [Peribacillus deserti]PLT29231.1 hypothetical protein CUU66_13745 [Peribacillus deserti]